MRIGLLVLFLLGDEVIGAKILALFPFPFYSHTHAFIPVFRELAARGHHLTFLSPYPQIPPPENWTNIVMDKIESKTVSELASIIWNANSYQFFTASWALCEEFNEEALRNDAFKRLLGQEALDYDVIITESLLCHEALTALGAKHNIPVVGAYPLLLSAYAGYFTGDDYLPSYIADCRTPYTDNMSFLERFENTILAAFQLIYGLYHHLPKQELFMEKHIYNNSKNHPPLVEILKNISIHLIDTHNTLAYPRSYQPRTIPVGGLSTVSSSNMTKDLKEFLDNSPNGFIYLNFGSLMPVSSLSPAILDAFLAAFNNLNVNVLMKWENDKGLEAPQNVKTQKWLPQQSILSHPKCRLFISHGGIHGISEAIYHGVPIVGIPFFSDQKYNVRFAAEGGFGFQLLKEDISAENFHRAIETVLNDKSYKEHAMRRSEFMRDRPASALETAVYWIEYTLRHKDLSHLRPASSGLPLYKLYLLDVFAVTLICLLIVFVILFYSLRASFRIVSKLMLPLSVNKNKCE